MDNITHSLIGLAAGNAIARLTPGHRRGLEADTRRNLIVAIAIIGGNSPDLDLLYSYRGPSGQLAYLLGHRGYTHTVIGCMLLALLLYAGIEWWMRRRGLEPCGRDRLVLATMAAVGTALHLVMDALNSYGVHPFWPIDDRWSYGDSVFIIEPLYWVSAAPLVFALKSGKGKALLCLLVAAGALLGVAVNRAAPVACAFVVVFTSFLVFSGVRATPRTAAAVSASACLLVTLMFIGGGRLAARQVETVARRDFPADTLLDHVLNPTPANPLCWEVLALQVNGDRYAARRAVLSLAPALIAADHCGTDSLTRASLAPQTTADSHDDRMIRWREFSMSGRTLGRIVATHCDAAALMHFVRAPFAVMKDQSWIIGDLRFDRSAQPGLAAIRLDESRPVESQCPSLPPWTPPRLDLVPDAR